jgi:molecular chaperone GrpE (heat shock protein)
MSDIIQVSKQKWDGFLNELEAKDAEITRLREQLRLANIDQLNAEQDLAKCRERVERIREEATERAGTYLNERILKILSE